MRKSPARKSLSVVMLLGALLSGPSAYCQKPAKDDSNPPQTVSPGPYYALVIGNNNYRHMDKLQTAVKDATEVAKLLQERYGFAPPQLLLNATREQILIALNDLRRKPLPKNSNLVIYYAGHGLKDPGTKKAYWLPVDAQENNDVNWISSSTITEEISALPSAHILVISDSCYSGELSRSASVAINPSERTAYLSRLLQSPSRTLMASGSDQPVADGGKDGHSQFAYILIQGLQQIDKDEFTAKELFVNYIEPGVAGNSDQLPQYSIIQNSGHMFGDFVFSRGGKEIAIRPREPMGGNEPVGESQLPEIACKKELTPRGPGPKIKPEDPVPCQLLDQPLKWVAEHHMPELRGTTEQTRGKVMLTLTVDEYGWVIDIKLRGGTTPPGIESALKAASRKWQTNQPIYKGTHVKSSFALDIDFDQ